MSQQESKTTLDGIVARAAPVAVAVIFRRGPSRHVQMIRWDLRDDTLTFGQWLLGTVQVGPSGLSPDGQLLVYAFRKGSEEYTSVSRPPCFTALACWARSAPDGSGGFFPAPVPGREPRMDPAGPG